MEDWLEDARDATLTMEDEEAAAFIRRHLEGPAREEVTCQDSAVQRNPVRLFQTLMIAFAERQTAAALRCRLYDRVQGKRETLMDFARALSCLVKRLSRKDTKVDENQVLCEVFVQNVRDRNLRRELRRVVRDRPDIGFMDLRACALEWVEEDEDEIPPTTHAQRVQQVQASDSTSEEDNGSLLHHLQDRVKELSSNQSSIVGLLQQIANNMKEGSNNIAAGSYRRRPRTPLSKIRCFNCQELGHYQRNCRGRVEGNSTSTTKCPQAPSTQNVVPNPPQSQNPGNPGSENPQASLPGPRQ